MRYHEVKSIKNNDSKPIQRFEDLMEGKLLISSHVPEDKQPNLEHVGVGVTEFVCSDCQLVCVLYAPNSANKLTCQMGPGPITLQVKLSLN
jgi:hypothetical protein